MTNVSLLYCQTLSSKDLVIYFQEYFKFIHVKSQPHVKGDWGGGGGKLILKVQKHPT